MKFLIVAALLAALPGLAFAQTVYKCKSADGNTVYSQQPCSAKAEARVVKGQGIPSDLGDQSKVKDLRLNVAKDRAQLDESNCVRDARDRVYPPSNRRIAIHEDGIRRLNSNIAYAANNLAGATWESGMRQQISGLQQAIATERASAESLFSSERQICTDARRRADEEIAAQANAARASEASADE